MKSYKLIGSGLLLIGIVLISMFVGVLDITDIADDYIVYDDFSINNLDCVSFSKSNPYLNNWISKECVSDRLGITLHGWWSGSTSGSSDAKIENGYLSITPSINQYGNSVILNVKEDFYAKDVKIKITNSLTHPLYEGYGSSSLNLMINDINIYSLVPLSVKAGTQASVSELIEILPSKLNPKEISLYINGEKVKEFLLNKDSMVIKMTSNVGHPKSNMNMKIDYIKYRLKFNCVREQNDLLGMETFKAGDVVDLQSFSKPIKSFCLAHPVIITDADGSTTTAEPYEKLIVGNTLNVPEGQTWTVFYIFNNDANFGGCIDGAVDVNTGQCKDLSGIVHFCSQGEFDADQGACIVVEPVKKLYGYTETKDDVCKELGYEGYDSTTDRCFEVNGNVESSDGGNIIYLILGVFAVIGGIIFLVMKK